MFVRKIPLNYLMARADGGSGKFLRPDAVGGLRLRLHFFRKIYVIYFTVQKLVLGYG